MVAITRLKAIERCQSKKGLSVGLRGTVPQSPARARSESALTPDGAGERSEGFQRFQGFTLAVSGQSVAVRVLVVQVRIVGMAMDNRLMGMAMRMRFARKIAPIVLMPMVLIMRMRVVVILNRMLVLVFMVLAHMEPETHTHQDACDDQLWRDRF
jgi:hypothetical protein